MSDSPSALPSLPALPALPVSPPAPAAGSEPPVTPAPAAPVAPDVQPSAQPSVQVLAVPRSWAIAVALLAAGGLLASGLLWQKLGNIQEELARRSIDSASQAIEARTLAKSAQESTRDLSVRLALQETRISEVSLQRSQLEELMQSLSRSRDENLVVDIDSALRLAQQQAQLTGSAQPLIAALTSAEQRLSRAAQPRLNPLRRSIIKDTDRIKVASLTDVPVLLIKLDELVRLADELPVANAMVGNNAAPALPPALPGPSSRTLPVDAENPMFSWFDSDMLRNAWRIALDKLQGEARKLLRVSRIEQPEAALLSPEQSFFLRENLKLKLLNARLGLLSRQTDTARADLTSASVWLVKYFDPTSRKTQTAAQLLQQVQSQLKTSELPRLDDTLSALATAAAGR